MTQDSSFSIAELARRCEKAMVQFQRQKTHDLSSCYELFRLALKENDQEAWSALYSQYHRLVRDWSRGSPGDPDDLVNEAFARFWRAIPAERFGKFPTVPALLAYLKRCAKNLVIDEIRREERREKVKEELRKVQELALVGIGSHSREPMRELVLERASTDQLFEHIRSRLKGRREWLVFHESFVLGLPPREIAKRWPDLFADAKEVSRVKERIQRRLGRDAHLEAIREALFPRRKNRSAVVL